MDKTETYIKMCEKAPEIQCLWKEDDEIYCVATKSFCWTVRDYIEEHKEEGYIWLPRQDQLQEMISPHYWYYNLLEIIDFHKDNTEYVQGFKSMEQLWLAFVMKEKYGKTWDGEQWVSIS